MPETIIITNNVGLPDLGSYLHIDSLTRLDISGTPDLTDYSVVRRQLASGANRSANPKA